ncbi:hypothetical protein [Herbaspirillum sp. B65]|uniref:hypothetical protein n=1 Tax=Herbaspirillum sp. B65 TaxID=137708 RepID=UPI00034988B6|nr:hypothetical protein [Herbaspirillum sp. B65]
MSGVLFDLHLRHAYFASGLFENCRVEPAPGTADLIRRYQCLPHVQQGIFRLRWGGHQPVGQFIAYLARQLDGAPLQFYLCTDDAWFAAATDLPMDWVGQIALSSQDVDVGEDASIRLMQPHLTVRSVQKNNVIAVVSIFAADLRPASPSMSPQPVSFRIEFAARRLYWNYLVTQDTTPARARLYVGNSEGASFQAAVPAQLPDGAAALSFSSAPMQFPLAQLPAVTFDLMESLPIRDVAAAGVTRYVERCLIQGLPTPQVGQFRVKQVAGKQCVFSDMYVYV